MRALIGSCVTEAQSTRLLVHLSKFYAHYTRNHSWTWFQEVGALMVFRSIACWSKVDTLWVVVTRLGLQLVRLLCLIWTDTACIWLIFTFLLSSSIHSFRQFSQPWKWVACAAVDVHADVKATRPSALLENYLWKRCHAWPGIKCAYYKSTKRQPELQGHMLYSLKTKIKVWLRSQGQDCRIFVWIIALSRFTPVLMHQNQITFRVCILNFLAHFIPNFVYSIPHSWFVLEWYL